MANKIYYLHNNNLYATRSKQKIYKPGVKMRIKSLLPNLIAAFLAAHSGAVMAFPNQANGPREPQQNQLNNSDTRLMILEAINRDKREKGVSFSPVVPNALEKIGKATPPALLEKQEACVTAGLKQASLKGAFKKILEQDVPTDHHKFALYDGRGQAYISGFTVPSRLLGSGTSSNMFFQRAVDIAKKCSDPKKSDEKAGKGAASAVPAPRH